MMAVTAFASTPMPEKNQKATLELKYASIEIVADVLPTYVLTVEAVGTFVVSYDAPFVTRKNSEPFKLCAIVTDVGWSCLPEQNRKVPYVEKLNAAYLIDHEKNLRELGITSARHDC